MEKIFSEKNECSGCTACYSVCGKKAITMIKDKEGFLYPSINKKLCVNCGICKKMCSKLEQTCIGDIYAVKSKKLDIQKKSQSGGIFYHIANEFINSGGIVVGVVYSDKYKVKHTIVTNTYDLKKLQGSKYIQSEIGDVFIKIKKLLNEGKRVLFSGTPCQVNGLIKYIANKEMLNNLLTIDIICHGVPSPLVFENYVNYLEEIYNGNVENFNFRDKRYGWGSHYETFYINKKLYKKSIFKELFYKNIILRPSCTKCNYANFKRVSDITIGDFWGIEKYYPNFYDKNGVSLVMVNTTNGKEIFESVKEYIFIQNSSKKECIQPNLIKPSEVIGDRNLFWNEFDKYGIEFVINKYGKEKISKKFKDYSIRVLKKLGVFEYIYKLIKNK